MSPRLPSWLRIGPFAAHVLIATGVVICFYLMLLPFGIRLSLGLWTVGAVSFSVLIYTFRGGAELADSPSWVDHVPVGESRRFQSDLATRRLSDMVVGAQPGRGFSNNPLALALYHVTADRLVARHGADEADPLHSGRAALSPALLAYLTTVEVGNSPAVPRRTLHRYLKEIESL